VEIIPAGALISVLMVLQWGHDFSAVEMMFLEYDTAYFDELQWGHDFSAVEIRL